MLPTHGAFWRTAAILLLAALCCRGLQLPWPANAPLTLRSWRSAEFACSGIGASSVACVDALARLARSERPVAMLVASAAWRHGEGDVYGSAHALLGALTLLRSSSSSSSSVAADATQLHQEILGILHRVLDHSARASSPASTLYPAQITPFSDFAAALLSICRSLPGLRVVIEVGSGAGAGSSSAIVGGVLRRPPSRDLLVFFIEIGAERSARLAQRYAHLPFARVITASAISLAAFPSAAEVSAAHAEWRAAEYSLSDALKWRRDDWEAMRAAGVARDGIASAIAAARQARAAAGAEGARQLPGDGVDVAVLDGSEFSGWQELALIYGARAIALDDTRTLKHRRSRAFLLACGCYAAAEDRLQERNGWAIFTRVPGSACAAFA